MPALSFAVMVRVTEVLSALTAVVAPGAALGQFAILLAMSGLLGSGGGSAGGVSGGGDSVGGGVVSAVGALCSSGYALFLAFLQPTAAVRARTSTNETSELLMAVTTV